MNTQHARARRWYDKHPEMGKAVNNLITMPYSLQLIIAEGIVYLLNKEYDAQSLMRSVRSLGVEKTLALHKASARNREYDLNPMLHQAMNYLYMLPEADQNIIASKIQELLYYNMEYFKTCKEFGGEAQLNDVANITSLYVECDGKAASELLNNIREEFLSGIRQASTTEKIASKDGDLKITGGNLE